MGRNIVSSTSQQAIPVQAPPIKGGAAGVIVAQPQETHTHASAMSRMEAGRNVRAPQFRVMNGGSCVLDNMRVPIRAGKIVDETMYDLAQLRQQGIVLEPLDAPPSEPQEGA